MSNGNGNHHNHGTRIPTCDLDEGLSTLTLPLQPLTRVPDGDRMEGIIRMLLYEMGIDVTSEHFRETPRRVARLYREFTRGYYAHPSEILKTFRAKSKDLVVVSHVDFFSLCPHHLLVYGGQIHFAYMPEDLIVGVSKIPRLVRALARRPVVQETLAADIADAFLSVVKPLGCAVKAISQHDCVAARGVKSRSAVMTTVVTRGIFQE